MNANIVSWNLLDGLSDPNRADEILHKTFNEAPAIAVFSEGRKAQTPLSPAVVHAFDTRGYQTIHADYGDIDGRPDSHGLVVAVRNELLVSHSFVRLAGRSAILLDLRGGTQLLGAHFLDRRVTQHGNSSTGGARERVQQAQDALSVLRRKAIIAGDLNDMYADARIAPKLRAFGAFARLLPSAEPGVTGPMKIIGRPGSVFTRLASMAEGKALKTLEGAGFTDADKRRQPTMQKMGIKVQLDHILTRDVDVVEPTRVEAANGLSDHDMIVATVNL